MQRGALVIVLTNSQIFVTASGESLVAITVAGTGQPYVNVASSR
jgi:hypothetical protein